MTEPTDNLELSRTLGLAAEAQNDRDHPQEKDWAIDELREIQVRRYRILMGRVQEALALQYLDFQEARRFIKRIRDVAAQELGDVRAVELLGREGMRPPKQHFERMIENVNQFLGEFGQHHIVGLDAWSSYFSSMTGASIDGVVAINSLRRSGTPDLRLPVVNGSVPRILPSLSGEHQFAVVAAHGTQLRNDGEHQFGTISIVKLGTDRISAPQNEVVYLPMIDGFLHEEVDGMEILNGSVVTVTDRGWTGEVGIRVEGSERSLPVIDGKLIHEIEGRPIRWTRCVAPTNNGLFTGVVTFDSDRGFTTPHLILDGMIVRSGEREMVADPESIIFHDGSWSGNGAWSQPGGTYRLQSVVSGEIVEEYDNRSIAALRDLHIVDGQLNGSALLDRSGTAWLPIYNGELLTAFQGQSIRTAGSIENIDGKLNGILEFSNGHRRFIMDGENFHHIDGQIVMPFSTSSRYHNIDGTLNGDVVFPQEGRALAQGQVAYPRHQFVMGKQVV